MPSQLASWQTWKTSRHGPLSSPPLLTTSGIVWSTRSNMRSEQAMSPTLMSSFHRGRLRGEIERHPDVPRPARETPRGRSGPGSPSIRALARRSSTSQFAIQARESIANRLLGSRRHWISCARPARRRSGDLVLDRVTCRIRRAAQAALRCPSPYPIVCRGVRPARTGSCRGGRFPAIRGLAGSPARPPCRRRPGPSAPSP
jgi:hypothetical protein